MPVLFSIPWKKVFVAFTIQFFWVKNDDNLGTTA